MFDHLKGLFCSENQCSVAHSDAVSSPFFGYHSPFRTVPSTSHLSGDCLLGAAEAESNHVSFHKSCSKFSK